MVAGFMDTAGYIKLLGLFVSSVTGNLIVASTSVYKPYGPALCRVVITVVFAASVGVTTAIAVRLRIVEEFSLKLCAMVLIVIEVVIIMLALGLGVVFEAQIAATTQINSMPIMLVGSLMAASMGVHIATVKECIPRAPSTIVMTMNLVTISINAAICGNYFLARHNVVRMQPRKHAHYNSQIEEKFAHTSHKLFKSTLPLASFIVGALLGTVCVYLLSFWALFLPVGVLSLMLADIATGYIYSAVRVRDGIEPKQITNQTLDPELCREELMLDAAEDIAGDRHPMELTAF